MHLETYRHPSLPTNSAEEPKKEVTVIRGGSPYVIPRHHVVVDDVIQLQRGDQTVVDGLVLHSNHLEIDESLLTGESVPVLKSTGDQVLSGSFCLSGNGYYVAEKVGGDSYASQVTKLAKKYKFALTPLQKRINAIVKALFAAAIVIVILKVLLAKTGELLKVDSIREIGTILDSLVPQGLVLMSSVTFAIGVYRISKTGAIVQRLNAIESFSSVQVACMDKTGTLTQDMLTVHKVVPLVADSEESITRCLGTYARFSSDRNSTIRALEVFGDDGKAEVVDEIPFSPKNKMSFLRVRRGESLSTFVLGAYDLLLEKTATDLRDEARRRIADHGLEVYRNLLFGRVSEETSLDDIRSNFAQFSLDPICIVSIADRVREDAREVINLFERRGIELKILSGDAATAIQAVCRDVGWDVRPDDIISGSELDRLDGEEFAKTVRSNKVFARLKPEHKLRIVKELRAQKIHTAMIGDGVNDLPAIKEADLGIAMEEGSAVTKEVADIVLLNNKFSVLPKVFDEGNRIVNTVGSVAKLFLTKNFMVVCLALLSSLFLLEFPLTPRRVSLINVFAIGLPSLIIAASNRKTEPYGDFLLDLFTFVGISTIIIVASGHTGFFLAESISGIGHAESEMVMVSVMIVLSLASFLAVTVHKTEENKLRYVGYALVMLFGYSLLVGIRSDSLLMRIARTFYEIDQLKWQSWRTVLIAALPSSLLLLSLQTIRERLLSRKNPR